MDIDTIPATNLPNEFNRRVKEQVDKWQQEITAGAWHPNDITKAGQRKAWASRIGNACVLCAMILTGTHVATSEKLIREAVAKI